MIYNVTGGGTNAGSGGVGGTLTITAPKNVTVTVSKDDKIRTKSSGVTGVVIFRGLVSGTWTITITNGEDTATKTVDIKADYSTEITFFSAIINVTYPAGLVCTATNGNTTLSAPDTSGTWACPASKAGTWIITAGDWSGEAVLTENGQQISLPLVLWIVKNGTITDIGLSTPLISGQEIMPIQEDGSTLLNNTVAGQIVGVLTGKKLDLTGASRVIADVDALVVGSADTVKFKGTALLLTQDARYSSVANAAAGVAYQHRSTKTGRQNLTIDTSAITGQWYVGISMSSTGKVRVYDLHLEI